TFVAQSNVAGTNGIFNIDTAGRWTYVTNSALDDLVAGQSVVESFTVASADGATTTVQVTIIGTNDAAILIPALVTLDETNAPLITSGTLNITDVDSAATFVEQSNIVGAYGTFNIDTAGSWTYVANSAFDDLNVGQSVSDKFTVASADGTTTPVSITIIGTNDAAILSKASVELDETNEPLTTSGTLSISDVDSAATFVAQNNTAGAYGTFNIDAAGAWTYVAKSAFDSLLVGQSITDSLIVASVDGTTTTVQVTINGTNEAAVLSSAHVLLSETNEILHALGTLIISDVDSPETFVAQSNVAGTNGIFNIDTAGRWTYDTNSAADDLNVGQSVDESFTVASADGTTTTVQVTIIGTNDAAILSAASVSLDETNAPLSTSGTLSVSDVDSLETFVEQSNTVGVYGTFSINSAGAWTYVANSAFDDFNIGQSVNDTFTVVSADGTTTSVDITINGTNDPAILSQASVKLDETNEPLTTSGTLSISDVDNAATFVARAKIGGKNGSLKIDATGAWTYVANSAFDNLSVGRSVSDTFTVASDDGTTTTVQITINGTNDPAFLGTANVVLTETNSVLRATGKLKIKDVDNPETFATQSNVAGANGTFSIDTSGRWIYLTSSAFDYLNEGESIIDSFTVASEDGTTTTVKVTIEGSEESRFNGIWVAGKAGINRSNLDELKTRSALTYGFEEGYNWEVGILQLGAYGSYELNTTATGPVNYNSQVIGAGAKLGFPKGKWLLYGKLGYARTNGGDTAIKIGANHIYRGLGIEYKFANHWSVSGEYTNSNGNTVIQTVERRLTNKNITIGLNFYVGVPAKTKPPAPVSAPTPATAPVVEPAIGPAPTPQSVPPAPTTAPAFEPSFGAAPQPASPATAPVPVLEPAFGPVPAPTPQPVPLVPAPAVQVVPLAPAPVQGVEPAFGPAPSPAPVPQPAPPVPAPEPAFEPAF
ncbi:MAG: VCBS domain-containing protein, partial [Gallionella sp.]